MERKLKSGLDIDPKPKYQSVVENSANMANLDKKNRKKYANVLNEDELHPDNIDFMRQVQA